MKKSFLTVVGVLIMCFLFGCGKKVTPEPEKPVNTVEISIENRIKAADIWVLPDNDTNRKTSVWGKAMVSRNDTQKDRTVLLEIEADTEKYLIRMIDEDEMYYKADGIIVEKGDSVIIREGDEDMTAVVEVHGTDGELTAEYSMFVARL